MKRPTIVDLSEASGLSISTINRLLHGTGSVKAQNVDLIVETAERIGFYGLGALKERTRTNLPHRRLSFLLQQSHRPIYQLWAERIEAAAERSRSAIIDANILFEDDLTPEAVAANLLALGEESDAIAVVAADHPLVAQAIDELRGRSVPVVAFITDLSAASRAGFVGTDNWKAGRTAAWFINQTVSEPGKVYPFIGSHRYQCQDISDASFRSYMREHSPHLQVCDTQLTQEEPENAYEIVSGLLAAEPDLRGLFINGGGISGVLKALRELPDERRRTIKLVCRDIGPETRRGLNEGLITASLCHAPERMPLELIDVMLHLVEKRDSSSIEQRIVPFEILTQESVWT
ncbi:LacI family transcriptional regulator [Devosia sp. YR412]|uniref:substrate-binding domain-containing protein n=1 Tax=Devosia sp. YR412 TaxID=1881030 RepID=UPI0008BBE854|nr:substrate-binding domain-containing protein [Devosia sp. YR412]SEQ10230.1 LacI family transcriptional regulator [Devosia sp. YR412]